MVKKGYTTVSAMVGEYIANRKLTGTQEEENMKRWASDRSEEILGTEQLVYSVDLIDVVNGVGKMPKDVHSFYLVMVISDVQKCWNREQLVGYTKKIYGTDCDVEVNLICPQCNSSSCTGNHSTIDVQVDDVYLMAHPWLWAMTSSHYIGYVAPTTDGFPCDATSESFKIMKPRSANMAIWNSEHFLGICNKIGDPSCYKYEVENGHFITDMRNGQVLVAFLRYPKDDEGYFLIPNYRIVTRAVMSYIDEMMTWRYYMKDGNQTDRLRWLDSKNQAEQLLAEARSEVETPDPDKWTRDIKQHWIQDRSRFHYGRPS